MNSHKNKCVFLDRDGVINREMGDYVSDLSHFYVLPGVCKALKYLKQHGYLLIVTTNQAGIAKKLYDETLVYACHKIIQQQCDHLIDDLYFAPQHPSVTESLMRKPDSLMFEKAMARHAINPALSWMVGDSARDIIPASKLQIKTIGIGRAKEASPDYVAANLLEAAEIIVRNDRKI